MLFLLFQLFNSVYGLEGAEDHTVVSLLEDIVNGRIGDKTVVLRFYSEDVKVIFLSDIQFYDTLAYP